MRKNIAILFSIVALIAIVALMTPLQYGEPAMAAAPTPVAGITDKVSNDPGFIIYTAPISITADTRYCPNNPTAKYDTLDIEYAINQGAVNTVTIKAQYTNRLQRYVDGDNVVAANAADTVAFKQMPTFGQYTCLFVDVANSNSISLTLTAVGK